MCSFNKINGDIMNKNKVDFFAYIKNRKNTLIIIVLLILGLLLLIFPGGSFSKNTSQSDEERLKKYVDELEKKIESLCSNVQGVSNVSVSVYLDSGFETVYAYNEQNKETSNGINSEKKYVTVGSGNDESMVCIVEKMPNICGIAIVCKGGGNPLVANQLINLISSAYNIPKNKIYVAEGKK